MKNRLIVLMMAVLFNSVISNAQEKKEWDVNNPPGESKNITISTDEGTWMNVDLSPDGRTLVFDMLGDIFTMPVFSFDTSENVPLPLF